MACLLQGIAGVLQGFLPIHPSGLCAAHQHSGTGCPYWWLHGPIHPKYVLWGCSLAILQAAPSWWRCSAEWNQGLSEHGGVAYHLGSGNYPRNAAWQMSLRCFTKCPCRAHQWSICRGAQETVWYHCEKFPRRVLNHHQLGPYNTGTVAGSAHQMMYPMSAIYRVNLESGLVTEDDMVPMENCQVLSLLCPLQRETVMVDSQHELPCGSIGTVTTGQ